MGYQRIHKGGYSHPANTLKSDKLYSVTVTEDGTETISMNALFVSYNFICNASSEGTLVVADNTILFTEIG